MSHLMTCYYGDGNATCDHDINYCENEVFNTIENNFIANILMKCLSQIK